MKYRKYFTASIGILIVCAVIFYSPKDMYIFPNLSGPAHKTIIPEIHEPISFEDYSSGTTSRLAILLTDTNSNWLGLAHGLKSIGVPFLFTTDYKKALKHKTVMVYPIISGKVMSEKALKALAEFPKNGGTLIGSNVLGGGLKEVFGFENVIESKGYSTIAFKEGFEESEKAVKIGSISKIETNTASNSYTNPQYPPIAIYEDGSAAITHKPYKGGDAYALGIDYGQLLAKGYNNREDDIKEHFVNHYQPTLDVLLRVIKKIYTKSQKDAVTLGTVPFGKDLAVIITHDIDFTKSIKNAVDYAKYEAEQGIKATYFIQVKYLRDWNDDIFFDNNGVNYIRQLEELGMEVASHSVSHALNFSKFPTGSGEESYPEYQPYVESKESTPSGTILGELRVSKFLLDNFLQDSEVVSFRPGHLSNPFTLPQSLQATDYLYSSSVTANKSLTHLPFQLTNDRGFNNASGIFEFPITIEDEIEPKLGQRLPEAIKVAQRLRKHGGLYVILIHTDILGHKFEFQKGFIEYAKDFAWFGTIRDFGDWWKARDKVEIDVTTYGKKIIINVNSPEAIEGLVLEIPKNYRLKNKDDLNYIQEDGRVIIRQMDKKNSLELQEL